MSANKVCKRCVEWSKIGLSDTCPDCDRADNVPQKPKYHSKSEMKRIECMKEDKPDATPRDLNKVDRALEMQVIDWLQWNEFVEELGKPDYPKLALELISKQKAAYNELNQNYDQLLASRREIAADSIALKARVAELEQDHKDDMREYGTMLDEIAAARADSKRLSDAIQDGIDNCCKHTDRIAELEGQLKAKVNLETVFVADSYEAHLAAAKAEIEDINLMYEKLGGEKDVHKMYREVAEKKLTQANARIAELEQLVKSKIKIGLDLADELEEQDLREQKLVAALWKISKCPIVTDGGVCSSIADAAIKALAEHKGGG